MPGQKNKGKASRAQQPLPTIPEKLYFTIGEVSNLCDLKPHVLRYWEQEFGQLSPSKRRGNRRYYQRNDVLLIREIRALLYEQGFTIEGARHKLSGGEIEEGAEPNKAIAIEAAVSELEQIAMQLED